ncbi:SIMPL domain-containing protein [Caulobacter sp. 73W]|uniref:SIMPL domain-containing protein n=1 Tax=Caulobacter sp. 73W TaxID=3161137 RepID=A0AB39KVP1_9CAUL
MLARTTLAAALTLAFASAASAQMVPPPDRPMIIVTGMGKASKPAEFALLGFTVTGEGKTPAEALKAMNATREKIEANLRGQKELKVTELTADHLNVQDARGPACSGARPIVPPIMNTGDCAVIGAIASTTLQARLQPPTKLGDVASLVVQLGGKAPRPHGTGLLNRRALEAEATTAAVADARREAEVLAKAAAVKLGPILRIQDGDSRFDVRDLMVSGNRMDAPPPPMPIPPVMERVESPTALTIRDIEANARVTVIFSIEP